MFWGPSVWAGLRAQAIVRRSLGRNKIRQRYTLQVGLPLLFELVDTQRSWVAYPFDKGWGSNS